ncbi:hypothetical protein CSC28_3023 [Pseudomonas paraeruginosa]|nr:hypothetical protein CSC28_3023 [Pseudomonas paraeruginosa]
MAVVSASVSGGPAKSSSRSSTRRAPAIASRGRKLAWPRLRTRSAP